MTSFVIFAIRRTRRKTGTVTEINDFYRQVLMSNLAIGWWSIPGIIWTPMALAANSKAMRKIRAMAASPNAGPGWLPDPSGRYATRFWDGQVWTSQVQTVTSDPVA